MTQIQNTNNQANTSSVKFNGKGGDNDNFNDSSDEQTLFQTKRLFLSSKDEYIQKQQGSVCKSEISWLPGAVRATPAIRTAISAYISLALIAISLALIYAVLENFPASSNQQESLRDHSLLCLLLPMLIIYYTNGAIVEQYANMFTVSKHKQLANILQLQRTLGSKGSQIQINFDGFLNTPKADIATSQNCKVHGSLSSGDCSNSAKSKFARANLSNALYINDCSKRAVLFSDDFSSPTKVPTTQKVFGNLFNADEKFRDVFAYKQISPRNETSSDDMNMSESSCSTDASYGLQFTYNTRKQSKKQVKENQCTCTPNKACDVSQQPESPVNSIDAETLGELLTANNAPSFTFNVLEVFLLTCNVSQHLMDMKEIFLVKAWLIISTVILMYFITVTNFSCIDAELESIRKEELKESRANDTQSLKYTGDKPSSKDSIKSDILPTTKALNGKQAKRRMKQTSVSNLLKQEKDTNAKNQIPEDDGTLILTEKDLRENKTLMIFNSVQILKQVGECLLRTCFFIFNVLMFCISVINMNDDF